MLYVHFLFLVASQSQPLTSGEVASQQEARKLTHTFSLEERDSSGVDQKDLSNLQKVRSPALLCSTFLVQV